MEPEGKEEGPFRNLPTSDVFINVLHLLSIPEIAKTRYAIRFVLEYLGCRLVSQTWYTAGKRCITVYEIGLNRDGMYRYKGNPVTGVASRRLTPGLL